MVSIREHLEMEQVWYFKEVTKSTMKICSMYFNCILKKKVLVPISQVILLQTLCCCVQIVLSPETTIKKTLTLLLLDQKKIARFFSNAQWDKEFPKADGIWYEIFGWYSLDCGYPSINIIIHRYKVHRYKLYYSTTLVIL